MYAICSEHVNVRCAVGIAVKPYDYLPDTAAIRVETWSGTVESQCDHADLIDEIHHAQIGN